MKHSYKNALKTLKKGQKAPKLGIKIAKNAKIEIFKKIDSIKNR